MEPSNLQKSVHHFLNQRNTPASAAYHLFMALLVVIISVTFVIETYPLSPDTLIHLQMVDQLSTLCFLVDFCVRWWATGFTIPYLFKPLTLIDIISILPLFLTNTHWGFVRVIRLFRILRLLRLLENQQLFRWKFTVFHLTAARIFFTLFCMTFISAGIIYHVEGTREGTAITSFFEALYFTVVSLSTVGYGDIAPVTLAGRATVVLMIMTGGVLIPWQLTSLARHLLGPAERLPLTCQACGLSSHEVDARHCRLCGSSLKSVIPEKS